MAFRFLNLCKVAKTCVNHGNLKLWIGGDNLLKTLLPVTCSTRTVTFFNERSAEFLWDGVTSVSNAGRRRGRGRAIGKKMIKDLNKGQMIGVGKLNIQWPGLNTPIIRGRELVRLTRLPEDSTRQNRLIQIRESMGKGRSMKQHPLERGWSGGKLGGKKLGPPDPIGEDKFDGFETWILEAKVVSRMTGNLGRQKNVSAFVVSGNGNGLAGFALAKAPDIKGALRKAKNKTVMKLMYINRYKEHTVLHDFFCQFGKTKIYVSKMYEGYGLICHRAIRECCKAIGIKDIYAKVEGAINYQHIVKAFFIGLLQQKTHEQLAEEKQLHLVEFRKENQYLPTVAASPTKVRKPHEIKSNECLDFNQYVMNEKIVLRRKKPLPFYIHFHSYAVAQKKKEYLRNQDEVRIRLYAEHGELRSFMTDEYPEAKPALWSKKKESEENVE